MKAVHILNWCDLPAHAFLLTIHTRSLTVQKFGHVDLQKWGTDWASQVALVVKNPSANTGDIRDKGSIPGLGRSPGGRHSNPLQYPCLENPTNRETWRAIGCGVAKSQTGLKQLSVHTHICYIYALNKNLKDIHQNVIHIQAITRTCQTVYIYKYIYNF